MAHLKATDAGFAKIAGVPALAATPIVIGESEALSFMKKALKPHRFLEATSQGESS